MINCQDNYKRQKAPPTWDNPKDLKKKQEDLEKKQKRPPLPDMGTYKPHPVTFDTFARTFSNREQNKKIEAKSKLFGTCNRFFDPKMYKRKLNVPGPGNYDMIAKWSGKTTARTKDSDTKNWMQSVTKGVSNSIYYTTE